MLCFIFRITLLRLFGNLKGKIRIKNLTYNMDSLFLKRSKILPHLEIAMILSGLDDRYPVFQNQIAGGSLLKIVNSHFIIDLSPLDIKCIGH